MSFLYYKEARMLEKILRCDGVRDQVKDVN